MKNLLEELEILVEKTCKLDKNNYGYGIWSHHVKPMIQLGYELSDEYGGDKEIITIAILLHDIASIEDPNNSKEHHIIGSKRAEAILKNYNYPDEKIDKVKSCILNHRGIVNNKKTSIEEICVADADAIIHLKEISTLFFLAYSKMNKTMEEGKIWIKGKLERDYEKLSERSKEKYKNEFKTVIKLLE